MILYSKLVRSKSCLNTQQGGRQAPRSSVINPDYHQIVSGLKEVRTDGFSVHLSQHSQRPQTAQP